MRRTTVLLAIAALAVPAAGCGGDVEPIAGDDAPAVTVPGTGIPYENGGADGSGADGDDERDPRGGVAAGADSEDVRGAD